MGVRVLADKKHKFTILTQKPADEAHPTLAELNATTAIEACMKVLAEGFRFTPVESGTQNAKALCGSNEEVFTDENFAANFTIWRYYLEAGGADPSDDKLFAAVKERGTTLWGYTRISDEEATEPWAQTDEIRLGARFTVDHLQDPESPGWISYVVPARVQAGWPFTTVGPVTP